MQKSEKKISIVAPQTQTFVRHRIEVLERYRRIAAPEASDTKTFADELGLTVPGFRRLFRVWVERRDPTDLAAIGGPRQTRGLRDHTGDEFVKQTFDSLPRNQSISALISALYSAAEAEGITLRGWNGMRDLVTELARERGYGMDGLDSLFMDFAAIQIPVAHPETGQPSMPIASVFGRTGHIFAVRLSMAPISSTAPIKLLEFTRARGLLDTASGRRSERDVAKKIRMNVGSDPGWVSWLAAMADTGFEHDGTMTNRPQGGVGAPSTYPYLLGFASRPKTILREAEDRPAKRVERIDEVVSLEAAQEVIDARLRAGFEGQPLPHAVDLLRLLEKARSYRE